MELYMVLEGSDWARPIIFGTVVLSIMLLLPMVIINLTKPKFVKERLKLKKKCTMKTQGRVLDLYGTAPAEFRQNLEAWSGGDRTIASYEYFVNGVRYTGRDEIFLSLGAKGSPIDVLYDPNEPSNSCTPYGRRADKGTNYIIPVLIVIGVIAFIVLFLTLISASLGSRYR